MSVRFPGPVTASGERGNGRTLARRRPADPDRRGHRLRHRPARLRTGRPADTAARPAPRRPGTAAAQATLAAWQRRSAAKHGPEFRLDTPASWPTPQHHSDQPLWHRTGSQLGPAAPTPDPPHLLDRPPARPARHRRHPNPATGRAPARRPRPQATVAVVLRHRGHRRGHRPLVAVPTQIRPGTHLPTVQTNPRLDPPKTPHTAGACLRCSRTMTAAHRDAAARGAR